MITFHNLGNSLSSSSLTNGDARVLWTLGQGVDQRSLFHVRLMRLPHLTCRSQSSFLLASSPDFLCPALTSSTDLEERLASFFLRKAPLKRALFSAPSSVLVQFKKTKTWRISARQICGHSWRSSPRSKCRHDCST